jgi:2-oxoacid:acceptor oxidoreductase gamma subunit (pyruvate/2-ketoisovalerate family)
MIEIRFHGRGGQGAVVASKIMAKAVFLDGKYSQSFPAFGVERRGAPVTAFLRVDNAPIRLRTEIYEPDHLVILDPILVEQVPVTRGLTLNGIIVINSNKPPEDYKQSFEGYRVATVRASTIAFRHHLGSLQSPIVNTAILGAVAKVFGIVTLENLLKAIKEDVPVNAEDNAEAAKGAYRSVSDVVAFRGKDEIYRQRS